MTITLHAWMVPAGTTALIWIWCVVAMVRSKNCVEAGYIFTFATLATLAVLIVTGAYCLGRLH